MVDTVYTYDMTERKTVQKRSGGKGVANTLYTAHVVIETAAAVADGATFFVKRLPSNARISGLSRVYFDDLASSGSPTLDVGVASVDANVTSDPNGLSDAHDIANADITGEAMIDLFEEHGDYLWDFVNGQTTDPKGELDIYCTVVDAATNQAGTVMFDIFWYFD